MYYAVWYVVPIFGWALPFLFLLYYFLFPSSLFLLLLLDRSLARCLVCMVLAPPERTDGPTAKEALRVHRFAGYVLESTGYRTIQVATV